MCSSDLEGGLFQAKGPDYQPKVQTVLLADQRLLPIGGDKNREWLLGAFGVLAWFGSVLAEGCRTRSLEMKLDRNQGESAENGRLEACRQGQKSGNRKLTDNA